MSEEVVSRARGQGVWLALGQVATRAFQFLTTIVLARLLLPEHFGKVAIAAVVWEMVALLGNTGVVATLVHRRDRMAELCEAAFWLNLSVAAGISLIAVGVAAAAVRLYDQPALLPIMGLYAASFLIGALGTVNVALLTREVAFGRLAIADALPAIVSGLVSIALAAAGFGFWSLVVHAPAIALIKVVLLYRLHPWRPGLSIRIPLWGEIFGYGRYVLGMDLAGYVNLNGDYLITGKILGEHSLGIYSMAYRLANYPVEAGVWLVSRIAFPTLSALQGEPRRLAEVFQKMLRVVAVVSFPVFAVLFVVAPDLVAVLFGEERWGAASPLIRILIPYVIFRAVGSPAGQALLAVGRARTAFRFAIGVTPVLLVSVYVGTRYGIQGVAVATSAVLGGAAIALTILSGRAVGVSLGRILASIGPGTAVGAAALAAAGIASWAVSGLGPMAAPAFPVAIQWARLLLAGTAGALAAWLVTGRVFKEDYRILMTTLGEGSILHRWRQMRRGVVAALTLRMK